MRPGSNSRPSSQAGLGGLGTGRGRLAGIGQPSAEAFMAAAVQRTQLEQRVAAESAVNILKFITQNMSAEELWLASLDDARTDLSLASQTTQGSSEAASSVPSTSSLASSLSARVEDATNWSSVNSTLTSGFMSIPAPAWLWYDSLSLWERVGCFTVRSTRWNILLDRIFSHPVVESALREVHMAQSRLIRLLDLKNESCETACRDASLAQPVLPSAQKATHPRSNSSTHSGDQGLAHLSWNRIRFCLSSGNSRRDPLAQREECSVSQSVTSSGRDLTTSTQIDCDTTEAANIEIEQARQALQRAEQYLDSLIVCTLLPSRRAESSGSEGFSLPPTLDETMLLPFTVKAPSNDSLDSKKIDPPASILTFLSYSRRRRRRSRNKVSSTALQAAPWLETAPVIGLDPIVASQVQAPQLAALLASSMTLARSQEVAFTDPRSYETFGHSIKPSPDNVVKSRYFFHALSLPNIVALALMETFNAKYAENRPQLTSTLPFSMPSSVKPPGGSDEIANASESEEDGVESGSRTDPKGPKSSLIPHFLRIQSPGSAAHIVFDSNLQQQAITIHQSISKASQVKAAGTKDQKAKDKFQTSLIPQQSVPPGLAYFQSLYSWAKSSLAATNKDKTTSQSSLAQGATVTLNVLGPSPFHSTTDARLYVDSTSPLHVAIAAAAALVQDKPTSGPPTQQAQSQQLFEAALLEPTNVELDQSSSYETKSIDTPKSSDQPHPTLSLQLRCPTTMELRKALILPRDDTLDEEEKRYGEKPVVTRKALALTNILALALASMCCVPVTQAGAMSMYEKMYGSARARGSAPHLVCEESMLAEQAAIDYVTDLAYSAADANSASSNRASQTTKKTADDDEIDFEALMAEDENEVQASKRKPKPKPKQSHPSHPHSQQQQSQEQSQAQRAQQQPQQTQPQQHSSPHQDSHKSSKVGKKDGERQNTPSAQSVKLTEATANKHRAKQSRNSKSANASAATATLPSSSPNTDVDPTSNEVKEQGSQEEPATSSLSVDITSGPASSRETHMSTETVTCSEQSSSQSSKTENPSLDADSRSSLPETLSHDAMTTETASRPEDTATQFTGKHVHSVEQPEPVSEMKELQGQLCNEIPIRPVAAAARQTHIAQEGYQVESPTKEDSSALLATSEVSQALAATEPEGQLQPAPEPSLWAHHHMKRFTFSTSTTDGLDLTPEQIPLEIALGSDVVEFVSSMESLARLRQPWKHAVINAARTAVAALWPESRVEVFGSFATGLGAPSSDVDLVVCDKHHYMLSNRMLKLHALGTTAVTAPPTPTQGFDDATLANAAASWKERLGTATSAGNEAAPRHLATSAVSEAAEGKVVPEAKVPVVAQDPSQTQASQLNRAEMEDLAERGRYEQKIRKAIAEETRARAKALALHMQRQSWAQNVICLDKSLVPIVKVTAQFKEAGAQIQLDFSFDAPSHRGLSTCALVRGLVAEWPLLHPLTITLREFLSKRGLNDPFSGGLASYGLVLMITHLLHRRKDTVKTTSFMLNALNWTNEDGSKSIISRGQSGAAMEPEPDQPSLAHNIYQRVREFADQWVSNIISSPENQRLVLPEIGVKEVETKHSSISSEAQDSPAQSGPAERPGCLPHTMFGDLESDESMSSLPASASPTKFPIPTSANPTATGGNLQWRVLLALEPLNASYAYLKSLMQPDRPDTDPKLTSSSPERLAEIAAFIQSYLSTKDSVHRPLAHIAAQKDSTKPHHLHEMLPFKLPSYSEVVAALILLRRAIGAGLLGSLLMDFLNLYGNEFSPAYIIDIKSEQFVKNTNPLYVGHPLVIVDPFDPSNNVGRSCFGIQVLQAVLRQGFTTVHSAAGADCPRASTLTAYASRHLVPAAIIEGAELAKDFQTFVSAMFRVMEQVQQQPATGAQSAPELGSGPGLTAYTSANGLIPNPHLNVPTTTVSSLQNALAKFLAPYFFYRTPWPSVAADSSLTLDEAKGLAHSRPYIFDLLPVTPITAKSAALKSIGKHLPSRPANRLSSTAPNTTAVSLLGALFDTGHHKSVTQYALALYLPPNPRDASEDSIGQPHTFEKQKVPPPLSTEEKNLSALETRAAEEATPKVPSSPAKRPVPPPPPRRPTTAHGDSEVVPKREEGASIGSGEQGCSTPPRTEQLGATSKRLPAPAVPVRRKPAIESGETTNHSRPENADHPSHDTEKADPKFGVQTFHPQQQEQVDRSQLMSRERIKVVSLRPYLSSLKRILSMSISPLVLPATKLNAKSRELRTSRFTSVLERNKFWVQTVALLKGSWSASTGFPESSEDEFSDSDDETQTVDAVVPDKLTLVEEIKHIRHQLAECEGDISNTPNERVITRLKIYQRRITQVTKQGAFHLRAALAPLAAALKFWYNSGWRSAPEGDAASSKTSEPINATTLPVEVAKEWAQRVNRTFESLCMNLARNAKLLPEPTEAKSVTIPQSTPAGTSSYETVSEDKGMSSGLSSDSTMVTVRLTPESTFAPAPLTIDQQALSKLDELSAKLEASVAILTQLIQVVAHYDFVVCTLLETDLADGQTTSEYVGQHTRKLIEDWLFTIASSLVSFALNRPSGFVPGSSSSGALHHRNYFVPELFFALVRRLGRGIDSALSTVCTSSQLPYSTPPKVADLSYANPSEYHTHPGPSSALERVMLGIASSHARAALCPDMLAEITRSGSEQFAKCPVIDQFGALSLLIVRIGSLLGGLTLRLNQPLRACCFDPVASLCQCLHSHLLMPAPPACAAKVVLPQGLTTPITLYLALPCIVALLSTGCADRGIFMLPNPWTASICSAAAEICVRTGVSLPARSLLDSLFRQLSRSTILSHARFFSPEEYELIPAGDHLESPSGMEDVDMELAYISYQHELMAQNQTTSSPTQSPLAAQHYVHHSVYAHQHMQQHVQQGGNDAVVFAGGTTTLSCAGYGGGEVQDVEPNNVVAFAPPLPKLGEPPTTPSAQLIANPAPLPSETLSLAPSLPGIISPWKATPSAYTRKLIRKPKI